MSRAAEEVTLHGQVFDDSMLRSIQDDIRGSKFSEVIKRCEELRKSEINTSNPQFFFIYAKTLLESRDFIKAHELINNAINLNRSHPDYFELKAQISMYLGHHLESLHAAERTLSLESAKTPEETSATTNYSIGAYVLKAVALKQLHKDTMALDTFKEAVTEGSKFHHVRNVELDLQKSLLARFTQQYDQGEKYSQYVIDNSNEFASGYVNLGINLLLKSQKQNTTSPRSSDTVDSATDNTSLIERAIQNFDIALLKYPNDSIATYYKGKALEAQGNESDAKVLYQRACELSPGYVSPVLALVYIHMQNGKDTDALECLDALIAINAGSEEALLAKSKLLVSVDRLEEAQEVIDQLLLINPECGFYYYNKAMILSANNKPIDALEACVLALSFAPNDIDALHHKALIHSSLQQYSEALHVIELIHTLDANFALGYQAKAHVLSEMITNSGLAFVYYYNNYVVEKDPLIVKKIENGEVKTAEYWYYNNITGENKQCADVMKSVELFIAKGEPENTIPLLDYAIKINPKFVDAHIKLASVYMSLNRNVEAEAEVLKANAINLAYAKSLISEEKLPYIEVLENETIALHDLAIKNDPSNPILHVSKACSLVKFHIVEGLAEVLTRANGLISVNTQEDQSKNTLLKTAIELMQTAEELRNSIEDSAVDSAREPLLSDKSFRDYDQKMLFMESQTRSGRSSFHMRSESSREMDLGGAGGSHLRFASFLPENFDSIIYEQDFIGTARQYAPSVKHNFLNVEVLEAASSKADQTSCIMQRKASSVGSSSILEGDESKQDEMEETANGEALTLEDAKEAIKIKSMPQLVKAAQVLKASLSMANDNKATLAQNNATLAEMKDVLASMKQELAELAALKEHVAALEKKSQTFVKTEEVSHAIRHNAESVQLEKMREKIESDPALSQYHMSFIRTIETFLIGSAALVSGMFTEASYTTSLSLIPLPPIVSEIVTAAQALVDKGMSIRVENQSIRALNSLQSGVTKFMADTLQKLAAHASISNTEALHSLTEVKHAGFFKIIGVYESLRDKIFEREDPTKANELGASHALKVIAALKTGKIEITGLTDDTRAVEILLSIINDHTIEDTILTMRSISKGTVDPLMSPVSAVSTVMSSNESTDDFQDISLSEVYVGRKVSPSPNLKWYQKLACSCSAVGNVAEQPINTEHDNLSILGVSANAVPQDV